MRFKIGRVSTNRCALGKYLKSNLKRWDECETRFKKNLCQRQTDVPKALFVRSCSSTSKSTDQAEPKGTHLLSVLSSLQLWQHQILHGYF